MLEGSVDFHSVRPKECWSWKTGVSGLGRKEGVVTELKKKKQTPPNYGGTMVLVQGRDVQGKENRSQGSTILEKLSMECDIIKSIV